jgi:hypothetical protein
MARASLSSSSSSSSPSFPDCMYPSPSEFISLAFLAPVVILCLANDVDGNERDKLAVANEGRGIRDFESAIDTSALVFGIESGREVMLVVDPLAE